MLQPGVGRRTGPDVPAVPGVQVYTDCTAVQRHRQPAATEVGKVVI